MTQKQVARASSASTKRVFSQSDFDHFARLSGDNNPIHVAADFAARSRFGRTVAHGLLLCSVLRGLIEQLLPGGRLLDQSVVFPAPTYAGESMCFSVAVTGVDDSGTDVSLQVVRVADGTMTCKGRGRVVT